MKKIRPPVSPSPAPPEPKPVAPVAVDVSTLAQEVKRLKEALIETRKGPVRVQITRDDDGRMEELIITPLTRTLN